MEKLPIDLKYEFSATNPCSGSFHNQFDAMVFLAKDKAFLQGALPAYRAKCEELGANPAHLQAIDFIIERVTEFQQNIESKVPDTDLPCEIRRCVDGQIAEKANIPEDIQKYLSLQDVESVVASEEYLTPSGTMTICVLSLRNGAKVTGVNYGAIDPNRQNWEEGRKAARSDAMEKVWELEGYLLRQKLYQASIDQFFRPMDITQDQIASFLKKD